MAFRAASDGPLDSKEHRNRQIGGANVAPRKARQINVPAADSQPRIRAEEPTRRRAPRSIESAGHPNTWDCAHSDTSHGPPDDAAHPAAIMSRAQPSQTQGCSAREWLRQAPPLARPTTARVPSALAGLLRVRESGAGRKW